MRLTLVVQDPAVIEGCTWSAEIRADREPATPVEASFTVTAIDETTVQLVLSATDSAALRGFMGVWDVQVDCDGDVRTLVQGKVTMDPDVTRAP